MANLADLKQRVITDMSRDDLEDDLSALLLLRIQDACVHYSDTRFWFNQAVETITTVSGTAEVSVPFGVRIIDRIAGPYGDLSPAILSDAPYTPLIDYTDLPRTYTWLGGDLELYPVPNDAYTLKVYGLLQIDPPENDEDENAWTNEAARLIAVHTKMLLYRGKFRDQAGTQLAMGELSDELARLKRETERRTRTRLAARLTAPNGVPVTLP